MYNSASTSADAAALKSSLKLWSNAAVAHAQAARLSSATPCSTNTEISIGIEFQNHEYEYSQPQTIFVLNIFNLT